MADFLVRSISRAERRDSQHKRGNRGSGAIHENMNECPGAVSRAVRNSNSGSKTQMDPASTQNAHNHARERPRVARHPNRPCKRVCKRRSRRAPCAGRAVSFPRGSGTCAPHTPNSSPPQATHSVPPRPRFRHHPETRLPPTRVRRATIASPRPWMTLTRDVAVLSKTLHAPSTVRRPHLQRRGLRQARSPPLPPSSSRNCATRR